MKYRLTAWNEHKQVTHHVHRSTSSLSSRSILIQKEKPSVTNYARLVFLTFTNNCTRLIDATCPINECLSIMSFRKFLCARRHLGFRLVPSLSRLASVFKWSDLLLAHLQPWLKHLGIKTRFANIVLKESLGCCENKLLKFFPLPASNVNRDENDLNA